MISYDSFYKIFSRSLFRVALSDLLANIDEISQSQQDLPLIAKLAIFKRSMMLSSIGKLKNDLSSRGDAIL